MVHASFTSYWDTTVKPTIQDHAAKTTTPLIGDGVALYYLGQLLFRVEHDLADGRLGSALVTLETCRATLTPPSYWTNVWGDDLSSPEASRLKSISKMLETLSGLI